MANLRDKKEFRQSPSTTLRERPATNHHTNSYQPNMVFDHSSQKAVVPEQLGQTARYGENDGKFRTMNAGGKPFALDTDVGASSDAPSRGFGEK